MITYSVSDSIRQHYPVGIRCVISKDTHDLGSWFYFENVSTKLARITFLDKTIFLEPKEKTNIKVLDVSQEVPDVKLLNNGVS